MVSASPLWIWRRMSGEIREEFVVNLCEKAHSRRLAAGEINVSANAACAFLEAELSVFSIRAMISWADFLKYSPSSVRVTRFLPRIRSCFPSCSSSSIICFDSVGWLTWSDSAALVMLCSLAMARRSGKKTDLDHGGTS